MIRTANKSPIEKKLTQIEVRRVIGGVECVVDQSIFKVLAKRYAPGKLIAVTLSPDDAEALGNELLDCSRKARG
jgi:hypothetical protein